MSTLPPAQPNPTQPNPTQPNPTQPKPAARRAAVLPAKPRRDFRLPLAAAALSLILGFLLGVYVTRHRHEATTVVASINGTVISQSDFFDKLQSVAGQGVIHNMVEQNLQLQFAKKKGVAVTEAQVDTQLAKDQENPDFQKSLTARGLTLSAYRDALRVRLAQSMVYAQGVSITDAEVQNWYKAASNPANPNSIYYRPDAVSMSVISVPTPALAQRAMKELNSGTPFPLVATAYSTDVTKAQGGTIQPLIRGRNPVSKTPALERALFNLPVGGTYGPVEFGKMQWIFRCNGKTPSQKLPFTAVATEARQNALAAKGIKQNGAKIAKEFTEFQRTSQLKAFWPQYEQAVRGR